MTNQSVFSIYPPEPKEMECVRCGAKQNCFICDECYYRSRILAFLDLGLTEA